MAPPPPTVHCSSPFPHGKHHVDGVRETKGPAPDLVPKEGDCNHSPPVKDSVPQCCPLFHVIYSKIEMILGDGKDGGDSRN